MAFGIEGLKRLVNSRFEELDHQVESLTSMFTRLLDTVEGLIGTSGPLTVLLQSVDRLENNMPTRAEFDAAKQALGQAINDATTRVQNDIQALRDSLANGVQITDQDLSDIQSDLGLVGQIDPAVVPPPTP